MKIAVGLALAVVLLHVTVTRAEDGKIAVKDLPKAVTDAVKGKFPKARITDAETVTEEGKTNYEIEFKNGAKTMGATLTPKGEFLDIETEIAIADLPKPVSAAVKAKYPKGTVKSASSVIEYEDGKETSYFAVIVATGAKKDRELQVSAAGKILEDDEAEDE